MHPVTREVSPSKLGGWDKGYVLALHMESVVIVQHPSDGAAHKLFVLVYCSTVNVATAKLYGSLHDGGHVGRLQSPRPQTNCGYGLSIQ